MLTTYSDFNGHLGNLLVFSSTVQYAGRWQVLTEKERELTYPPNRLKYSTGNKDPNKEETSHQSNQEAFRGFEQKKAGEDQISQFRTVWIGNVSVLDFRVKNAFIK